MKQDPAFLTPHPRKIKNFLEPAILKRLQKEKRGQGVGLPFEMFPVKEEFIDGLHSPIIVSFTYFLILN
jgi:hypothetical protein